jgi:hypothetical protein
VLALVYLECRDNEAEALDRVLTKYEARSCWERPIGVEPRERYDTLTVRNKCTVFYVSHLMSGTGVPGSSSVEGRWRRSRRPFASPLMTIGCSIIFDDALLRRLTAERPDSDCPYGVGARVE